MARKKHARHGAVEVEWPQHNAFNDAFNLKRASPEIEENTRRVWAESGTPLQFEQWVALFGWQPLEDHRVSPGQVWYMSLTLPGSWAGTSPDDVMDRSRWLRMPDWFRGWMTQDKEKVGKAIHEAMRARVAEGDFDERE